MVKLQCVVYSCISQTINLVIAHHLSDHCQSDDVQDPVTASVDVYM
jgi:hypothetical protein